MANSFFPIKALSSWFLKNQRSLPWRETSDPYAIWISEVMLQQTQVSTALPYFQRWMERFKTLEDLAEAPIEEVIKYWEGLGYYSRARNLHLGAKKILRDFKGQMPSSDEELLSIKGIGPYTKGAIQSFAFKKRSVLVDGNVKRVLSRFWGLALDFSIPKNHQLLEEEIEKVLPHKQPWIFNEALMELGALICTPSKPLCGECPLKKNCFAKKHRQTETLPLKIQRKKRVKLYRVVFILHCKNQILIKKETQGIMRDLYEFPYLNTFHKNHPEAKLSHLISRFLKRPLKKLEKLPEVTHGFTHHHVTLFPFKIQLHELLKLPNFEWIEANKIHEKPFSSGHRKILKLIQND